MQCCLIFSFTYLGRRHHCVNNGEVKSKFKVRYVQMHCQAARGKIKLSPVFVFPSSSTLANNGLFEKFSLIKL